MNSPCHASSELKDDSQIDSSDPSPPLASAYSWQTPSSSPPTYTLRSQHSFLYAKGYASITRVKPHAREICHTAYNKGVDEGEFVARCALTGPVRSLHSSARKASAHRMRLGSCWQLYAVGNPQRHPRSTIACHQRRNSWAK